MDGRNPSSPVLTYRAAPLTCIGTGVIGMRSVVLAMACLRNGRYGLMLVALVFAAVVVSLTAWLRLELSSTQLRHRTVLGTRTVALDRITAAWIEAPRGAWSYWRALPMLVLSVHGAVPLVLNLRTLPDAAVVALGERLYRRGIGIGVANAPSARRVAARIWPPPRRGR